MEDVNLTASRGEGRKMERATFPASVTSLSLVGPVCIDKSDDPRSIWEKVFDFTVLIDHFFSCFIYGIGI